MKVGRTVPRAPRALFAAAMVGALSIFGADTVAAQTRAEINKRIDQLEKQLGAVQRRVFQGSDSAYFPQSGDGDVATAPLDAPAAGGTGNTRGLLADMAVRLDGIEAQLRALTGRIEELDHQYRQLEVALDRFKGDAEFRLNALEGVGTPPITGAAPATTDVADATPAPNAVPNTAQGTAPPSAGLVVTQTPEEAEAVLEPGGARVASLAPPPAEPALPEGSAEDRYEFALSLLRRGEFARAESAFAAFLDEHGEDQLAGNAQYWLGETYYVQQNFTQAAQAFLKGYRDYRDSTKGPDSLLKLGMTLSALDQQDDACAAFDELEAQYTDVSPQIRRRLGVERTRAGCG